MTLKEQIKKINYRDVLRVCILSLVLYYLMNVFILIENIRGSIDIILEQANVVFIYAEDILTSKNVQHNPILIENIRGSIGIIFEQAGVDILSVFSVYFFICIVTSIVLYTSFYKYDKFKSIRFIVLSSWLLYCLMYLLGCTDYFPKAAIAEQDMFFCLFVGIALYFLYNGNKKLYFIGFAVILWPTFIMQYFFIKIFDKPFVLSELINFWTLMQVSTTLLKLWYGGLLVLWSSGLCYLLYKAYKKWPALKLYAKIIPLVVLAFYSYLFSNRVVGDALSPRHAFPREDLFPHSILARVGMLAASRYTEKRFDVELTPNSVQQSFAYLKEIEKNRTEYPISQSPKTAPEKKRPIFHIIFESFYDFKEFEEYFDEDPFPKEYRDMVSTYSGPNAVHGSVKARFTSLTGMAQGYMKFPLVSENEYSATLPNILSRYGYSSYAFETINATYRLDTYYRIWGFDSIYFELFGRDYTGMNTDPNTYENNVMEIINNTPDDVVPFYFGFTYLGHATSTGFTEQLEDPKIDISRYLDLFEDKVLAKRLLKTGIFNAERMVNMRDAVLAKYPDALIVYRSDHISTEHYAIFSNPKNTLSPDFLEGFRRDPHVLPYIVIDGTNGAIKLRDGFSPENTPLLILAESGLPYEGTALSLLYRSVPKDMSSIYDAWYERNGDKFIAIEMTEQMTEYNKALETITLDLYYNKKTPLTLELLKK